MIFWCSPY
jgi:hypothetical protein